MASKSGARTLPKLANLPKFQYIYK